MVFYFSGTGNSRFVAKGIARAVGQEAVDITTYTKTMLMEHFDEISKAINDINMLKSKEKKAQAIELISRYAPEMAKMKEQLKSVNGYVEKLNKDIWDEREISRHWIGKTEQLEKEVKGKNIEIKLLQAKQHELQKEIDRIPPGLLKQLDAMERARRKTINRNDLIR